MLSSDRRVLQALDRVGGRSVATASDIVARLRAHGYVEREGDHVQMTDLGLAALFRAEGEGEWRGYSANQHVDRRRAA